MTSRIAELESRIPTLDAGEGALEIYRKTFREQDPPNKEVDRMKALVEVETVSDNRVADLASERMQVFIDRLTANQDISVDRIHMGQRKEKSDADDGGGLKFSISR